MSRSSLTNDSLRVFAFYRNSNEFIEDALNTGQDDRYTDRVKTSIESVYPYPKELDELINNFKAFSDKIDSGGAFNKSRLKISDDKRNTFMFALASKGLVRIPEYYNAEISLQYPKMFNSVGLAAEDESMVAGVVDTNLVMTKPLANGEYFYIIINGQEYPLQQQQKGTAKMLELVPNAKIEKTEGGMLYTDPTFDPISGFSLKFSSTFKKSYIEMPKEGGKGRAVDIFFPYDRIPDYTDLNQRITPAVSLILAAEYFIKARIKVRINILRPIEAKYTKIENGRKISGTASSILSYTVKDFDEPIDWNKIANLRGQYDVGAKLSDLNASIQRVKYNLEDLSGSADYLLYNDEKLLQKEMGRFKNFLIKEVEEGRIKTKIVPKPLMLVYGTETLLGAYFNDRVANQKPSTSSEQRVIEGIKNNFYTLIDSVDLYYNKKVSEVVRRVKKRFDEENLSSTELKNYLNSLAGRLYFTTEPAAGAYATPTKELEEAREKFNSLLNALSKEYQRIGI